MAINYKLENNKITNITFNNYKFNYKNINIIIKNIKKY